MEEWGNLNLNDAAFSKVNYNDDSWDQWDQKIPGELKGAFEAFFPDSDKLLSDGVIWFRAKINVEDTNSDYQLVFSDGIDDGDQTYFNGHLVGNTIGWNVTRNYKIPKELLKKGENVIALRVTDFGGLGGWRGPIEFKNSSSSQTIAFDAFKFKHHAFILANQFLVHDMITQTLVEQSHSLNQEIKRGMSLNNPNAYGVLFARMLMPVMPYTIKGAIWYQGESNVGNFQEYQNLFNGMIEDWRTNWGYEFPFYYVQIAPFQYSPSANSPGSKRCTTENTTNYSTRRGWPLSWILEKRKTFILGINKMSEIDWHYWPWIKIMDMI